MGMDVFEEAVRVGVARSGVLDVEKVRAVLLAAGPILQAEAWDEGAEAAEEGEPRNPYHT